ARRGGARPQGRQCLRLRQLHGRRHRRQLVQDAEGRDRRGERGEREGERARRRRLRRLRGLLRRADGDRDVRPGLPDSKGELFGPVVTAFVYPERQYEQTLDLIDGGAPYGLTGAVFARDRAAVETAHERLRYAAGNFYVNDKPTGAVVGQQPFGGAR